MCVRLTNVLFWPLPHVARSRRFLLPLFSGIFVLCHAFLDTRVAGYDVGTPDTTAFFLFRFIVCCVLLSFFCVIFLSCPGSGHSTDFPEPLPGQPLPVRHVAASEALLYDGQSSHFLYVFLLIWFACCFISSLVLSSSTVRGGVVLSIQQNPIRCTDLDVRIIKQA